MRAWDWDLRLRSAQSCQALIRISLPLQTGLQLLQARGGGVHIRKITSDLSEVGTSPHAVTVKNSWLLSSFDQKEFVDVSCSFG
jgi:hypothetical protein